MPVYFGGPVQVDRGFVLHRPAGEWQSTFRINGQIGLTTSRDILQAVGEGRGPRQLLVSLGLRWLGAGTARTGADAECVAHRGRRSGRDLRTAARATFAAAMSLLGIDLTQPVRRGRPCVSGTRSALMLSARLDAEPTVPARGQRAGPCSGSTSASERIGVAVGELALGIAHPLGHDPAPTRIAARLQELERLMQEWKPVLLVVGLPVAHGRSRTSRLARAAAGSRRA